MKPGMMFQHNDPKRTAKSVKTWQRHNKINVLDWLSQSPDLNPIENLWVVVKKNDDSRKSKNLVKLEKIVREKWSNISVNVCKNLIVY